MEQPVGGSKPLSPFQKLVGIVTSPAETAASIREKPDVLLPILLMVLLPLLPIAANYQGYLDTLVSALATTPQAAGMTADQMRELAQISAISGIAIAPVGFLIAWLVGSLILFGAVRLLGGECRYTQILSLKGYTMVFSLLATLVTLGVSLATGAGYTQQSYTSLLSVFPDLEAGFLYGIAAGVDLFSLWSAVVTGIGVAVRRENRRPQQRPAHPATAPDRPLRWGSGVCGRASPFR